MTIRSILACCGLAALLSLVACRGDSTSSDSADGRILFSYSGTESGRFVAKGDAENGNDAEYAVASLFQSSPGSLPILVIEGSMRLDNRYDAKVTILAPPGVGRTECVPGLYGCTTYGSLNLKARSGITSEDRSYVSRSIVVNVSEVTETRVRGTFDMTLEQVSSTGEFTGRTVEVRSGEIDVPGVSGPPRGPGSALTSLPVRGEPRVTRSPHRASP